MACNMRTWSDIELGIQGDKAITFTIWQHPGTLFSGLMILTLTLFCCIVYMYGNDFERSNLETLDFEWTRTTAKQAFLRSFIINQQ